MHSVGMATLERYHAHPLSAFLSNYRAERGNEASMCGIEFVKGKWLIPDNKYEEYISLLHDYLFIQKGRPINLVEQPRLGSSKPILIDLDFKFPIDTTLTHRFNSEHCSKFINLVKQGISTFFALDSSIEQIRFFVSMRPNAYADGRKCIKDGIHIQCPDICLTNDKQRVLREWLLTEKAIERSFEGVGYTNAVEDIYDESMVRKQGWFFYGESKSNIPPYEITHIYDYDMQENEFVENTEHDYTPLQLMTILSVRYNLPADTSTVLSKQQSLFNKLLNGGDRAAVAQVAKPEKIGRAHV